MKQPTLPETKEEQLSIFAGPANSRRTDPITSKISAHQVESSGHANAQRTLCLNAVRTHPGLTSAEIGKLIGTDRVTPSRRLPELRQAGILENGPIRVCFVNGTKMMTWYVVGVDR